MNTFALVKDLTFERIAGTEAEGKAINIISDYLQKLGVEPVIEEFEIPYANVKKATLVVDGKEYQATGFKRSGNINATLDLVVVDDLDMLDFLSIKGKACLIASNLNYKFYEELTKRHVGAIIDISGSLYDDINLTDLEEKSLRDRHLNFGKVPCFTIRSVDAEAIIASGAKTVTLELEQEEVMLKSHNLIVELPGSITDEIVCFTAHYDSVRFSKGAYDNATGSATILEMLKYYLGIKPKRTLRFIWCGAEEMGLLGSKAYMEVHKLEPIRLCINVDMTAVNLGHDICCVTGEDKIVNYLQILSKEVGFSINVKSGVYSSDSTPFADCGIPALSFARLSNQFGAKIHSNKDNGLFLSEKYFYNTCNFIKYFADHMINAIIFPINKEIPEKIQQEIDKYYGRSSK